MPHLPEHRDRGVLHDRLRGARAVTAELMSEVIGETCRPFPSMGQTREKAQIERFIGSGASTDAALALIGLGTAAMEGPPHRLRRRRMVLRAVARTRASRLTRSTDRNLSRGFAACDFERAGRGATLWAVEQNKRPHRTARREPTFRAVLVRQFRVRWRTNHCSRSL
jgi:hypothetical protein